MRIPYRRVTRNAKKKIPYRRVTRNAKKKKMRIGVVIGEENGRMNCIRLTKPYRRVTGNAAKGLNNNSDMIIKKKMRISLKCDGTPFKN